MNKLYGVILVGIEGAGKTRLCEELAEWLGWNAADADDFVPQGTDLQFLRQIGDQNALTEREEKVFKTVFSRPRTRIILALRVPHISDAARS